MESGTEEICANCKKTAKEAKLEKLKRCTQCKSVSFCGLNCQKKNSGSIAYITLELRNVQFPCVIIEYALLAMAS